MRIFNEEKTKELKESECNLLKGYFAEEEIKVGERDSLLEIIENTDGSQTTKVYDSLDIMERVLIFKKYTTKDKYSKEISDLENWFSNEYKETFEKCTRKIAMNLKMKDGSDPKETLQNLYNQAEINANRINELKAKIGD